MLKWTTRTQQSRKLHDLIRRLLRIAMELSNSRDTEGPPWTFSLPLMIISRLKMLSLTGNFPNFAQMAWGPRRVWPQQCMETKAWSYALLYLRSRSLIMRWECTWWTWQLMWLPIGHKLPGWFFIGCLGGYTTFILDWNGSLNFLEFMLFFSLHNRVISPSQISKESFKS